MALTHIWTQPHFNSTYAGWILELADYSFDIRHVPGNENIMPDILSRLYLDGLWVLKKHSVLHRLHIANPLPTDMRQATRAHIIHSAVRRSY